MPQSSTPSPEVSWSISAPTDFDEAVRRFLASQGDKEESLSSLVQRAVARCILSSVATEAKMKVRRLGVSQKELDHIIADGIFFDIENKRIASI